MHAVHLKLPGYIQMRWRPGELGVKGDESVQSEAALIEQTRRFVQRATLQFHLHVQTLTGPIASNEKMSEVLRRSIRARRRSGKTQLHGTVSIRGDIQI